MSLIQTPVWPQTCSVEFMSGLCADQSMSSTSCCCPRKALVPCAVLGVALFWVLDIHKVSSKNACCPGKHTIVEKPDVALAVESSIHHHHFTPLTVDSTPYYDWGAMVTAHWLDACIYWSLPLPAAHTSMTTTVKREARLITEDTVPPLSEVPPFLQSSPHMAISSVTQSQSGTPGRTPRLIASSQKTLPCSELTTSSETGGSSPRTNEQLGWKDVNDYQDYLFVYSGCGQTPPTSKSPLMWPTNVLVASQNFADEPLQHNILATSRWK